MIAVKGMKMPNSCSECNLTTRKTWNYACSINLKDIDCAETKRPKDCPLVEVDTCEDAISRREVKELFQEGSVKGHWIDYSDEGYVECSECGSATNCDGNIADLHFCFSCGAKMDEDEHTLKYADQDTMMPAT